MRSLIELGDITQHNVKQLQRLNTNIFPVFYDEKFYRQVLEAGELAKFAYYNDIVVGAVCCRIDPKKGRRLYVMTMGVLDSYQRLGIGTMMVQHVLNYVENDGNFDSIYLHVQVNNDCAIEFYKKFGFKIVETEEQYYEDIEPADAYVLEKSLEGPCNGTTMKFSSLNLNTSENEF